MIVRPLATRDHRIDFLRGFALVTIFINHVPGNVVEHLTLKNFGLSDSAELFVLLAGMAAAFAYFPRYIAGGALLSTFLSVKRAGVLYVAHIASTMVGIGIFGLAALIYADPDIVQRINITPVIEDPVAGLVGIATLTHQLGYHNILPMYVVLLLATPLVMLLARGGLAMVLFASIGLYAVAHATGMTLPNFPNEGGWFFNPLAWQLLFVVGFVAGIRILRGWPAAPYSRWLWLAAGAWLVGACIYHRFGLYGTIPDIPGLPRTFEYNEKSWLAFPRLMHVLALAYFVGHSPLMRWIGRARPGNPLTLLGRHGLPVFWLGTALSMVGQVVMTVGEPFAIAQVLLLSAGIAIQVAFAAVLDWSVRVGKSRPVPAPATAPAGAAALPA
jgi:hypothetical protein